MLAVAMVEVGLAVERGAEALVVAMALVMQAAAPRVTDTHRCTQTLA